MVDSVEQPVNSQLPSIPATTVNPGAVRDDYLIQRTKQKVKVPPRREANRSEIMKQLAALTLALFATVALGQRVAPGVNPGHYVSLQAGSREIPNLC